MKETNTDKEGRGCDQHKLTEPSLLSFKRQPTDINMRSTHKRDVREREGDLNVSDR